MMSRTLAHTRRIERNHVMFTLIVTDSDGTESEVRNASRAILEELGEFNLSIGARSYTITED